MGDKEFANIHYYANNERLAFITLLKVWMSKELWNTILANSFIILKWVSEPERQRLSLGFQRNVF